MSSRPWLLDLYCCAGGAARGYYDAGFDVVGVDIEDQPNYPYHFIRADALDVLRECGHLFDAIHASPPCQAYTAAQRLQRNDHPELVDSTRALLEATGRPWVIENVPGAPLRDPVTLCGAMFPPLRVYRHRLFETNFPLPQPPHVPHTAEQVKMGRPPMGGEWLQVVGNFSGVAQAREAMRAPWMTRNELSESIPPSYTEWVGRFLLDHVRRHPRQQSFAV